MLQPEYYGNRFKNLRKKLSEFNIALRWLPTLAHVLPIHVKASVELVIEKEMN